MLSRQSAAPVCPPAQRRPFAAQRTTSTASLSSSIPTAPTYGAPKRPSVAPHALSAASVASSATSAASRTRSISSASTTSSSTAPEPRDRLLRLPDGRSLSYAFYGSRAADARQICYFNGLWQCRVAGAYFKQVPSKMNIRLLCIDRPGVALSTPTKDSAGCAFTTFAADIAYLINYIMAQPEESERWNTFYFLAYSGGAAFALAAAQYFACNKFAPRGLAGLAMIAGLPPTALSKATMPLPARIGTTLLTNFPQIIIDFITADQKTAEHHDGITDFSANAAAAVSQANHQKAAGPNRVEKLVAAGGSAAKQSFFGKASNQAILKNVRKEVIPTADGMLWDAYRILSTWPIPPEKLSAGNIPIFMWYTATDEVIPMKTAQAFAVQLRRARQDKTALGLDRRIFLTELQDCDHFSILRHSRRIFGDLINS